MADRRSLPLTLSSTTSPTIPPFIQLLPGHATHPNYGFSPSDCRPATDPLYGVPGKVESHRDLLRLLKDNTYRTHPRGCILSAVDGTVLEAQEGWKKLYNIADGEDPRGRPIKDVCAVQANGGGPQWDNGLREFLQNPAGDRWEGVPVSITSNGEIKTVYVRRPLVFELKNGPPGLNEQWEMQTLGDGETLLFRNQRVLPVGHPKFAEGAQMAIKLSVLTARDPFGTQPLDFFLEPIPSTIAVASPPLYVENLLYRESFLCNLDWHTAVLANTILDLRRQGRLARGNAMSMVTRPNAGVLATIAEEDASTVAPDHGMNSDYFDDTPGGNYNSPMY
ncbi:unnamed protein product [Amoebophrya sp. A120]|nr:unnamed protein product [Amoebophrya sp. A120]|eukprot:GSA120T00019754001.1